MDETVQGELEQTRRSRAFMVNNDASPVLNTFSLIFGLIVNRPELLRHVVAVCGAAMGRCREAPGREMLWPQSPDTTKVPLPQVRPPVETVRGAPEKVGV